MVVTFVRIAVDSTRINTVMIVDFVFLCFSVVFSVTRLVSVKQHQSCVIVVNKQERSVYNFSNEHFMLVI